MYYFIVNPTAGSGRGRKIWFQVQHELQKRGTEYDFFVLRYKGEAREIAASLSKLNRPFTLVVVGGDGTLNEIFDGLSSLEYVTLGCIPTGSGNDFVRGLGLPVDPVSALDQILTPQKIRSIRIGTVVSHSTDPEKDGRSGSFGVSSGIGFDASVCNGAYRSGLKDILNWFHLGKLVYTGTALYELIKAKPGPMTIRLEDGRVLSYDHVIFAASMNLPYEGGGFRFAPDADPESDSYCLCIAEGISKLGVLRILPLAFTGKHVGKRGVHLIPFKQAEIHSEAALCVHTDGEILGFCTDLSVGSRKETLRVICPQK